MPYQIIKESFWLALVFVLCIHIYLYSTPLFLFCLFFSQRFSSSCFVLGFTMGENMKRLQQPLMVVYIALLSLLGCSNGEDPYRFYTWNVTYGDISPLGVQQKVIFLPIFSVMLQYYTVHRWYDSEKIWMLQGILINGKFPGPPIQSVTNDNLIINVFNNLDEPFLLTWWVFIVRQNILDCHWLTLLY